MLPADLLLVLLTVFTSAFTALTGVGGGMMLIALMPLFLPAAAIIPIHGATQLSSNASRAWFGRRHILWPTLRPYLFGALLGTTLFAWLVQRVSLEFLPPLIGAYILLSLWSPGFSRALKSLDNFFLMGLLQTGLGLFVGAPGPLAIALLHRRCTDNHAIISTGALMMTLVHGLKILVYMLAGFRLSTYWPLMLLLMAAAVLGSYLGTIWRGRLPEALLRRLMRLLLSLLAAQLLGGYLLAKLF